MLPRLLIFKTCVHFS